MIQKLIVLLMLAVCSKEDILHRRIRICRLIYFALFGFLFQLILNKQPFSDFMFRMVPGAVILVFSLVSHGSIGQGDGMLLMAIGIFLGAAATIRIIVYAVFESAFCALFLYFIKKKSRDYEMPFVPFLLAAYLADIVFGKW